jgi:transposase-like protein
MIALVCPACQSDELIHYGTTKYGSPRLRCKACTKTWASSPKSRSLNSEQEQAILRALAERTSQRGIARPFGVSRDTVRALRKKTLGD